MFFCYLAKLKPPKAAVPAPNAPFEVPVPNVPAVAAPKAPGVPKAATDVGVPKPPPLPKLTGAAPKAAGAGDAKAPTPGLTPDPNAPDTPAVNPTPAQETPAQLLHRDSCTTPAQLLSLPPLHPLPLLLFD